MLEWYRVGWDHVALMQEVADLVACALQLVGRTLRIERTSYRELYRTSFGFDAFHAAIATLRAPLRDISIDADGLERDDWLDLLMTHRLQPQFDSGTLLFVHDFPPSQCALARLRGEGGDAVAERFEAYLGPQELANGYHELADATEQRRRFVRDRQVRNRRGEPTPRVDEALLSALAAGLPDCAGVALGIERLLMAMLGTGAISDVLAFPFARA
jgi:lysyl-tRNA synthetase class 2